MKIEMKVSILVLVWRLELIAYDVQMELFFLFQVCLHISNIQWHAALHPEIEMPQRRFSPA